MIPRAVFPCLLAVLVLAGRPAAADMVVEIANRSTMPLNLAVSEPDAYATVAAGATWGFPASASARNVQVTFADGEVVCRGRAGVSTFLGASVCNWTDGGGAVADAPLKCTAGTADDRTAQCRVTIEVTPAALPR